MNTIIIETILLFLISLILIFFTVKVTFLNTKITSKTKILKLLEYLIKLILVTMVCFFAINKKILLLVLSIGTYLIFNRTDWRVKFD